jgi:hypothetical protein
MARDPDTTERSPARQADAERYRAAAEAALDQLDWCVAYLHRIRRSPTAAAPARKQSEIRRRLTPATDGAPRKSAAKQAPSAT